MAIGTTVADFGSGLGSNLVTITVTGQSNIVPGSFIEAFIMIEASADHNAYEHSIVPMTFRCGNIITNNGFDIVAASDLSLTGQWSIRWVWV